MDGSNPAPVDRWFIPSFIGFKHVSTIQGDARVLPPEKMNRCDLSQVQMDEEEQSRGYGSSPFIELVYLKGTMNMFTVG